MFLLLPRAVFFPWPAVRWVWFAAGAQETEMSEVFPFAIRLAAPDSSDEKVYEPYRASCAVIRDATILDLGLSRCLLIFSPTELPTTVGIDCAVVGLRATKSTNLTLT
jgi:hypothetical protein